MKRVPKEGIVGERALREASATEFGAVRDLLSAALRANYGMGKDDWVCIEAVYPERVVVRRDGRCYEFPYTISDDNQVTLGAAQEIVVDTQPVGARVAEAAAGVFIEALSAADASAPPRYLVRVIRAGTSLNNVNYPREVLREAAPLFDRVRVFAKSDADHIQGQHKGKDFRQLVGSLSESRFVEADGGEIQAVLDVLETSDVAAKLREAVGRGMTDLFGLSIDATGSSKRKGKFIEATKLTKVSSVDLIIEPGAGGQVIRFVESHQESSEMKLREQMLKEIGARNAARATALADATDEEVMTAYREAVQPASNSDGSGSGGGGNGAENDAPLTAADVDARLRMVEARANARVTIAGSKLPEPLQERLVQRFAEAASFTDADVTAAIEAERKLLGRLVEGAQVRGLGGLRVEAGEDRADKVQTMFDEFFDPTKPMRSFRECYVEVTGDTRVSGRLADCDKQRLREACGTAFREAVSASTFGDILGDSITRAMIRGYGNLEAYNDWRWLCDVVPVSDFREQKRTRMGGYGNLPAVAENAAYAALTSPTDEAAVYTPSKRGGTETVSLEAIANDDVGLIRRIPTALATAAGRTLYEFVYDFLASNALVYDGLALFVAGHNNLGTAALDATSFAAARLRMKRQAEKDSGKRLGITLRHLVIPSDLEEAAYNLFVRNSNQDETFVQSRKPTVHVVDYWTDANNWFATADNGQVPLIELGFYGGREEPELFVQDQPTQGSLFTNDQIKYKIRHIYSGAVRDFRGFDGSIVA